VFLADRVSGLFWAATVGVGKSHWDAPAEYRVPANIPPAVLAKYEAKAKEILRELEEGAGPERQGAKGSGTQPASRVGGSGAGGGAGTATSGARQKRKASDREGDAHDSDDQGRSETDSHNPELRADTLEVSEEALIASGWGKTMFIDTFSQEQYTEVLARRKRPANLEQVPLPIFDKDVGFPGISLKNAKVSGEELAPSLRRMWALSRAKTAELAWVFERLYSIAEGPLSAEQKEAWDDLSEHLECIASLEAFHRAEVATLRVAWLVKESMKSKSLKDAVAIMRSGSSVAASTLDNPSTRQAIAQAAESAEMLADLRAARPLGANQHFQNGARGHAATPHGGPRARYNRQKKWDEFGGRNQFHGSRGFQQEEQAAPYRGRTPQRFTPRGQGLRRGRGSYRGNKAGH